MNGNVDALKNLYVAFGGSLTDTYEDIADGAPVSDYVLSCDVINACAKKAPSGSGASLPAVSASDNGDVLTVVNGAWAKAEVPSQLPTVTADDNGDVLKVVDGAWAKATS